MDPFMFLHVSSLLSNMEKDGEMEIRWAKRGQSGGEVSHFSKGEQGTTMWSPHALACASLAGNNEP